MSEKTIFVTGAAGFVGYHVAKALLDLGWDVHGYDGVTDYYDVSLKHSRLETLFAYDSFSFTEAMLEDSETLNEVVNRAKPSIVIHLAAQAGVRYSLEAPRAYIDSNIVGTFNIMEASKSAGVEHLMMASTSSVYGGNTKMPFKETDPTDTPLTIYAATKKATESLGHSFAYINELPTTMFRFFTVYGPWGRPDMALFKFTRGILRGEPIDIYNNGDMYRDFTYIDDLVQGILALATKPPKLASADHALDGQSHVAPFRVVNIGNSQKINLLDFIEAIERIIGEKAIRNYMPMQLGDVPATWADASLLNNITGFKPTTQFETGVREFVSWYRSHYQE